jgi:hypothetical protein
MPFPDDKYLTRSRSLGMGNTVLLCNKRGRSLKMELDMKHNVEDLVGGIGGVVGIDLRAE